MIFKKNNWLRLAGVGMILGTALMLSLVSLPPQIANAQQPTGSVPTVTGTPRGPSVTIYSTQDLVGVFSGPDSESYPQVGILIKGQSVPAVGKSEDGYWVQVLYQGVPGGKGWVYGLGLYVMLQGGELPIVEAPPTATPRTTPTIDPTYAAAYGLQLQASALPTFTMPAQQVMPTFAAVTNTGSKLPFGLIIAGLVLIGILGAVVSFVRGSR